MSGRRRAFIDAAPGERRGVVTLDGRPERLLIERDGEEGARLGEIRRGRITDVSDRVGAWVDLGFDRPGLIPRPPAGLAKGALVEVEIRAEAFGGKGPSLAFRAAAQGDLGLVAAAPSLESRLAAWAPGAVIGPGDADDAEEAALAVTHALGGGLGLSVEPTRALVAVDVDVSDGGGLSARNLLAANLRAVREAARLLRLKSLSGLVVIDLAGFPKAHPPLREAAREAFGEEAVIGPVSPFGALELTLPRGARPVRDILLDPEGRPTARTVALRLARRLSREGLRRPGLVAAVCAPEVAAVLRPLAAAMGPKFSVVEEVGRERSDTDMRDL